MIEPTGTYPSPETKITTAKRQTIADFTYYSICQGQKEIGPIGYSPLPVNLVEAGFGQIHKLKQADPAIDLTNRNIETCDNPTFVQGHPNTNYLAKIAPLPPSCDKIGAGPCAAGVTPNGTGPTPTSAAVTQPDDDTGTTGTGTRTARVTHGSRVTTTTPALDRRGPRTRARASTGQDGLAARAGPRPRPATDRHRVDRPGQSPDVQRRAAPSRSSCPATLAGYGGSDLTARWRRSRSSCLLSALVLPAVIGYRLAACDAGRAVIRRRRLVAAASASTLG